MKLYSILLTLGIGLTLTGCHPVRTVYRTQYEVQEVLVPVAMEVPEVKCDFKGEDVDEIINKLLMCVKKQKKALDILREKHEESMKDKK